MRKRRILLNIVFSMIILLCLASFGAILMPNRSSELIIAVISLDVALLALYISLRTFYSIDEVNAISRMDGNVMENSRYRPNILRYIFKYPQIDFSEASEALMLHMEGLFRKGNKQSGAHLADSVQEVADMMILVPFFIRTDNQNHSAIHQERFDSLIIMMKKSVNEFKEISDGSCKLLEETVSLIDAVFLYQMMTASGKTDPSKLLEIRGSIFINPVSVILYNNYLGLYFLQLAFDKLEKDPKHHSLKKRIEHSKNCSDEAKALAIMYTNKAVGLFKKAKENIGEDTIWRAFVCFNLSRALYQLQLLGTMKTDEWEEEINESISNWMTSNQIVADIFKTKNLCNRVSWLQQALISQENKVRLTKVVFQIENKKTLTDQNGCTWLRNYTDLIETPFFKSIPKNDPQNRTNGLIKDIFNLLEDDHTPKITKRSKKNQQP